MFRGWTWKRWAAYGIGAVVTAAGYVFPPAAVATTLIGPFIMGWATRAPGDVTAATMKAEVEDVANRVVPAVVAAAVAHSSRGARAVAEEAGKAAAQALGSSQ